MLELESFFTEVIESPYDFNKTSYGAGANYGLQAVKKMKSTIEKYSKRPQNKLLKQLDAGFTSVSRGVEGFNDYELDKKFRETCKGIYEIKEDLDKHINW